MNRAQISNRLHPYRDPGFKIELINSMVTDLMELQRSLQHVLLSSDVTRSKMCGDVNFTFSILDNMDFIHVVDKASYNDTYETNYAFFNRLCTGMAQHFDPYSTSRKSSFIFNPLKFL